MKTLNRIEISILVVGLALVSCVGVNAARGIIGSQPSAAEQDYAELADLIHGSRVKACKVIEGTWDEKADKCQEQN
jgi:hypothetical protein